MNSKSLYQNNSTSLENSLGKSEPNISSNNVKLFVSLISPILFIVYLIVFVPLFLEYHRLALVEEWHNYLNSYNSYLLPLFGLVLSICIFSIISMIISAMNNLKYLGVINFISFLLTLSSLFLMVLALFPD